MYSVNLTASAEQDLLNIYIYISETLREPKTAAELHKRLKNRINSLSYMPERRAVADESPYKENGVRMLPVENYTAFYVVNAETETVSILSVIYNRREWRRLLKLSETLEL